MNERLYYPISEVCRMLDLKPHVLRYWESAFPMLNPHKNKAGNRVYRPGDVRTLQYIKRLLYDEGYTIEGARKKLEDMKKAQGQMALELEPEQTSAGEEPDDCLDSVRSEIRDIIRVLSSDPMKVDAEGGQD
jgi:DNA-binding transcriptional MerR regulator